MPAIWVDFDSPVSMQTLAAIGEIFELHPLTLKDVLSARQRPKVERFPNYQFIVTKMVYLEERLKSEQLSIFFGENFVLTFKKKQVVIARGLAPKSPPRRGFNACHLF